MPEAVAMQCPYCGEWVEVDLDELGPPDERYVEDCSVCCRPWTVVVARTEEGPSLQLLREDD